jgi:hypothetical protein
LDEKPEAKDGLYWIDLGGYNAKQVGYIIEDINRKLSIIV